jgi:hypothetical protein
MFAYGGDNESESESELKGWKGRGWRGRFLRVREEIVRFNEGDLVKES